MSHRLRFSTRLLYGAGEIAVSIKNAALNQFLLFFYVDIVHVSPMLVGVAVFFGRFWDAVTDPVVGYLSDTTRSRWGRRRPYVLVAVFPVALGFYLLFAPPTWSELGVFAYLVAVYIGLMTVFTLYATPYLAWGAELSDDYHERTSIVQTRALFGVLGSLAGASLPVAIASRFSNAREGFAVAAALLASVCLATGLLTGLGVREQRSVEPPNRSWQHFRTGLLQTFANRDFRHIFGVFCAMTLVVSLGNAVQLFVIKYWLGLYDFFPVIALSFGLAFVASFPLWRRLSQVFGKHQALLYGLGMGCLVPWGWFVVPPGNALAMVAFAALGGASSGAVTLAMSSAIDVIDFDELQTGERREGAYFGIWTLGLKTMSALGALLGGAALWVLGASGVEGLDAATAWRLVWLVGPLQVAANVFGLLMMRRIRWGHADVLRLQAALAERRQQRGQVAG
jgi:GPH family glycoside/pentoside/hexuronide:cation symporter